MKIFFPLCISIIYITIDLISRPTINIVSMSIGTIVCFIVSFFIYSLFVNKIKVQLLNQSNKVEGIVLNKSLINHKQGLCVNGGIGYLLTDKLVFIPNKFNFSKKEITIPYSEIIQVKRNIFWGINTLKIQLKSGKTEVFIFNTNDFYKNFQKMTV